MMINMDHTQQDLVNAVTQFIIRCMKQELSIISQQPYAMDYPKIIEDVLHQQNICIYDPEFHKYLEINPLRGKIMEMLSLLSRISCRLIIS